MHVNRKPFCKYVRQYLFYFCLHERIYLKLRGCHGLLYNTLYGKNNGVGLPMDCSIKSIVDNKKNFYSQFVTVHFLRNRIFNVLESPGIEWQKPGFYTINLKVSGSKILRNNS